jgi:phage gp16-like protein
MKKKVKSSQKQMTIDDLAVMTQRGFDVNHTEFKHIRGNLGDMSGELGKMNTRLDRIENLLIRAHDQRLDRLEDQMRRTITLFEKRLSIPFPK